MQVLVHLFVVFVALGILRCVACVVGNNESKEEKKIGQVFVSLEQTVDSRLQGNRERKCSSQVNRHAQGRKFILLNFLVLKLRALFY